MQISRRLNDWLDGFMQYGANSEPPTQFRLWTGVGVVAAALQRKCYMEWEKDIYPNMYICIIGPPGSKKGTAMGPGAELLRSISIPMSADAITPEQLIRRMSEANGTDNDPLTGEIIMHSSYTVFSEEFTVFLGHQNPKLAATLCDLYDCKPKFTNDTKTQGTDEIIGPWLNIIGATIPAVLRSALPLEAIGGGLTSRMMMIYGDNRAKRVALPIKTQEERELFNVLKLDLQKIQLMKGRFRMTEEFVEAYAEWYNRGEDPPNLGEYYGAYISRRSTHLRKLCMVLSASRDNSMVITKDDFFRAKKFIEAAEAHMDKVFAGVGQSMTADLMSRVMTYLAAEREVSYAELLRKFYNDADAFTMDRVIQTLDKMKYLEISQPSGKLKFSGPANFMEVLSAQA